jgi:hypothetical protein
MIAALERLRAERIRHKQTSEFQIKVGPYNYYPGKGTIFMDRDLGARPERGLDKFIRLVCKLRDRNPCAFRDGGPDRDESYRLNGFDIKEAIGSE